MKLFKSPLHSSQWEPKFISLSKWDKPFQQRSLWITVGQDRTFKTPKSEYKRYLLKDSNSVLLFWIIANIFHQQACFPKLALNSMTDWMENVLGLRSFCYLDVYHQFQSLIILKIIWYCLFAVADKWNICYVTK